MITKILAARYASVNHSTTRLKIMFAHCSLFIRLGGLSFLDTYKQRVYNTHHNVIAIAIASRDFSY